MSESMRSRFHLALASAVVLLTVLATSWRFRRGIDFTDEAFYLAIPLRFVLGDRPFVDELNVAQTTGILLYPFVQLHYWLHGTTGIFLCVRLLYLVCFGLVAASVYRLAKTRLPIHVAMLTGATCITFVPYGLPGLSYNTVSAGMLTVGLATTTRALLTTYRVDKFWRDSFYWGGAALAVAAFAYPSLVPVAIAAALTVFALAGEHRRSAFMRVAAGGASFALLVLPLFAWAGESHLREVIAYSLSSDSSNPNRLSLLWNEFLRQHTEFPRAHLMVIGLVALGRIRPVLALPFAPWMPLLAETTSVTGMLTQMAYVTSFALLGPVFAFGLRDKRTAWILTCNAWFPSALAGALTGWSSGNGAIASAVGFFPAAMVSGVLLALWVRELAQPMAAGWVRALSGYAPLVLLASMLKFLLSNDAVYRDGDLAELTAEVTHGPYKGLLTTPERKRLLGEMTTDIRTYTRTERALYYHDFTAGYLIAAQRPLVASVWVFPVEPRVSMDARFLTRKARGGDLIFRLEQVRMRPEDPIDAFVRARTTEVLRRKSYTISIVR